MSKFRTLIQEIGRSPAGFGFAAAAQQQRARHILVVAEVATAADAAGAVAAGADVLSFSGPTSELHAVAGAGRPAGIWLSDAARESVQEARTAGADFFVFDDGRAHASALAVTEVGRVLLLGADQDEQRLRSIAPLDLDAVLLQVELAALNVRDILALRRVAMLTGAPLLVACDGRPTTEALEAWRDAGAVAVLVRGDRAAIEATVTAAAAVPPRPKQRASGAVPAIGLVQPADDDDDDDL